MRGQLLYATPDFARQLSDAGYRVSAVRGSSRVHPGVPIVAVQPTGGEIPAMQSGTVPVDGNVRGSFFQNPPEPQDEVRPTYAGGLFDPPYAVE